jgi:cell division protease FtsH
VNEAALLAARRSEDSVHQKDFLDALEKLVLGPARERFAEPRGARAGCVSRGRSYAVCGLLVPGADPVSRVTIIPHGQALGVRHQRPEDDQNSYSEEYLQARIVGAMGGRAAEEVVYGDRTTGVENDIQQASMLLGRWSPAGVCVTGWAL